MLADIKHFNHISTWFIHQASTLTTNDIVKVNRNYFQIYITGVEVQSHRIWTILCFTVAYYGNFCKFWWLDCRHSCDPRCICYKGPQGISLQLFFLLFFSFSCSLFLSKQFFSSMFSLQIMQTVGFLGPAFFLTQLSHIDSPVVAVLCMTCSQVCFLFCIGHISYSDKEFFV